MAEAKHGAEKKCPICQAQPAGEDDLLDHVILCSAKKVVALTAAVGPSPLPDDFDVKKYTLDVKLSSHADKKGLTLSLTHNTSKHVFSTVVVTDDLDDLHTALLTAASNGQFTLSKPPATDAKRKGSIKALIYGHAYYLQPVGTETQRVHRIIAVSKKQEEDTAAKLKALADQIAAIQSTLAALPKHEPGSGSGAEVKALSAALAALSAKIPTTEEIAQIAKQGSEIASLTAKIKKQDEDLTALRTLSKQQGDDLAALKAAIAELKGNVSRPAAPAPAPVPAPLPVVVSSPSTAPSEAKSTITAGAKPKLLLMFGSYGSGDGQFSNNVYTVAVSPDNKIWVSTRIRVQVFSGDGKFLHFAATETWARAYGIAFAANGEAYIADGGGCVSVHRADGSFVRKIGSSGSGNGQFSSPQFVAVDRKQGLLFVADCKNSRVQVLKPDGTFVRAFGSSGSGDGQFSDPIGIAVNSATNEVAVSEEDNHRVQVFDYNGKFLRKFGSEGSAPGQLDSPGGMAVDSAGNWIVSDYNNSRVQVFKADGSFVTAFGEKGSGPGQFSAPYDVCVAPDGRIIVTDRGIYNVQVFRFD